MSTAALMTRILAGRGGRFGPRQAPEPCFTTRPERASVRASTNCRCARARWLNDRVMAQGTARTGDDIGTAAVEAAATGDVGPKFYPVVSSLRRLGGLFEERERRDLARSLSRSRSA